MGQTETVIYKITSATNMKLCYRRRTARPGVSVKILHNSVGITCTTSPEQIKVMELEGYSRPTYNKLVHSAMTRSTVVSVTVIHKLTVDEFVDHTVTPTTCCGEIF